MSIDTLVQKVDEEIDKIDSDGIARIWEAGDNYAVWGEFDAEYAKQYVQAVVAYVPKLRANTDLRTMPSNYLTAIGNHLAAFNQNVLNLQNIGEGEITNQHHQCLKQIQAFDNSIRTSGLYAILFLSPSLPAKEAQLNQLTDTAEDYSRQFRSLHEQVAALIDPSIAGVLSNAFSERVSVLEDKQKYWRKVLIVAIIVATLVTIDIVGDLIASIPQINSWATIPSATLTRLVAAGPIYFILYFAVTQFRRDRNLEEIYAHKSAIAVTLPNYRDLITDAGVKDSVTESAAEVIFQLPEGTPSSKSGVKGLSMKQMSKVADMVSKLTGRSSTT